MDDFLLCFARGTFLLGVQQYSASILGLNLPLYPFSLVEVSWRNHYTCSSLPVLITIRAHHYTCSSLHVLITIRAHHYTCSSLHVLITIRAHHYTCSSLSVLITIRAHHYTCSSLHVLITIRAHHYPCSSLYVLITIRAHHYTCSSLYVVITIRAHHYTCSSPTAPKFSEKNYKLKSKFASLKTYYTPQLCRIVRDRPPYHDSLQIYNSEWFKFWFFYLTDLQIVCPLSTILFQVQNIPLIRFCNTQTGKRIFKVNKSRGK